MKTDMAIQMTWKSRDKRYGYKRNMKFIVLGFNRTEEEVLSIIKKPFNPTNENTK